MENQCCGMCRFWDAFSSAKMGKCWVRPAQETRERKNAVPVTGHDEGAHCGDYCAIGALTPLERIAAALEKTEAPPSTELGKLIPLRRNQTCPKHQVVFADDKECPICTHTICALHYVKLDSDGRCFACDEEEKGR